ncbi:hypothetical protein VPHK406_0104 [Vibrio phage K406]
METKSHIRFFDLAEGIAQISFTTTAGLGFVYLIIILIFEVGKINPIASSRFP